MKKINWHDLIFYTMRFTAVQVALAILFASTIYANNLSGQGILDKVVTINVANIEVTKALSIIQDQANVKFVYSSKAISGERKLSINATEKKLGDLLNEYLLPLNIAFSIEGNKILLYSRTHSDPGAGGSFSNESTEFRIVERIVTGSVKDDKGNPLEGATVMLKSDNKVAARTDASGNFRLIVPEESVTIVVSYIGYKTMEVLAKSGQAVSITMLPVIRENEEVVVVGYGTQRKRNVTGSVSSVRSEQIRQVPVMSPEQALQGRASGVQVMQSNGAPGGAVQVQIRGVGSTSSTGNFPLYVVDGVPLFDLGAAFVPGAGTSGSPNLNGGSPLATLNPADIESMDVLKDASATAIYGARAANGVVVITTKSGKAGKTKFSADYYYGVQEIQKKWDLLNGVEGMLLRKEALLNTRSDFTRNIPAEMFNPFALASSLENRNVSWQDELFSTAPIQEANISASGGNDKVRFLASGNYYDQEGIFYNTNMQRISGRVNLDIKASDKLTLGLRTTISSQTGNNVTDANPFQGNVIGALFAAGFQQVQYPNGSYWAPPHTVGTGTFDTRNYKFEAEFFKRPTQRFRFNGNVFAEYELVKSLKFKSMFGVDFNSANQQIINPAIPRGPAFIIAGPDLGPNNSSRAYSQDNRIYNWVADQTLTFNKTFKDVHKVEALAGFSVQQNKDYQTFIAGQGSISPVLQLIGPNNPLFSGSVGYSENGLVSFFSRVNYSYNDKYLFTGTVRRDGSSNFGADNRYGTFPSFSAGWRLSKEKFMEKVSFIQDLKLRASWGLTGNQAIGSFGFVSTMGSSNAIFGSSVVTGFTPGNLANTGLKWEANEQTDIGVDFSLLHGRIQVVADYFVKKSKDLLIGIPIPSFSGFQSQTVNLGTIENKGWELGINAAILDDDFRWNLGFNISSVRNKVLDLGSNAAGGQNEFFGYSPFTTNGPINITKVGYPIGSFYGLQTNGIFRSIQETQGYPVQTGIVAQPGDAKYIDQNKDGVINDLDRVILGSPFPDFFGGITNDFSYKHFTLNIFANFVSGMQVFNHTRLMLEDFGDASGGTAQLQRFTALNPSGPYPRMTLGNAAAYNRLNSDRWIDDASFLRIRNITLGYNFPANIISKLKLDGLRVYTSVNNAFTFTGYKGWDPEVNSSGSNVLSGGIDQGGYPVARSFIFGFNLKF